MVKRLFVCVAMALAAFSGMAAGGARLAHASGPPASCADVKAANPGATDDTYTISPNGNTFQVYCNNMAGTPAEYLELQNTGAGANFSNTAPFSGRPGVTTQFSMVRIDPQTLTVDTTDYTFSSSTGSVQYGATVVTQDEYGSANGCSGPFNADGRGNIDLTGTPFAVAPSQFVTTGFLEAGSATYSSNSQIVDLTGGGDCGGTTPVNPNALQLVFLPPVHLTITFAPPPPYTSAASLGIYNYGSLLGYAKATSPLSVTLPFGTSIWLFEDQTELATAASPTTFYYVSGNPDQALTLTSDLSVTLVYTSMEQQLRLGYPGSYTGTNAVKKIAYAKLLSDWQNAEHSILQPAGNAMPKLQSVLTFACDVSGAQTLNKISTSYATTLLTYAAQTYSALGGIPLDPCFGGLGIIPE